nr:hypothetical protein CFP56_44307 [Quercus suber]
MGYLVDASSLAKSTMESAPASCLFRKQGLTSPAFFPSSLLRALVLHQLKSKKKISATNTGQCKDWTKRVENQCATCASSHGEILGSSTDKTAFSFLLGTIGSRSREHSHATRKPCHLLDEEWRLIRTQERSKLRIAFDRARSSALHGRLEPTLLLGCLLIATRERAIRSSDPRTRLRWGRSLFSWRCIAIQRVREFARIGPYWMLSDELRVLFVNDGERRSVHAETALCFLTRENPEHMIFLSSTIVRSGRKPVGTRLPVTAESRASKRRRQGAESSEVTQHQAVTLHSPLSWAEVRALIYTQQDPQRYLLNMEEPPAVPPKDKPLPAVKAYTDQPLSPPSASKRKREVHIDNVVLVQDGEESGDDLDEHTPKRSRVHNLASDVEASQEDTPAHQRGLLRRKQKIGNLSHLNLRHKAKQQQQQAQKKAEYGVRDSKFQEGSLTDKPSAKPPSIFTRMVRTDSGNLTQVDDLMADYHDSLATSAGSADLAVERERAMMNQRVDAINAEAAKKDDNSGLLRFGRQFVSNFGFHPVNLWNKVWNDTREELPNKNLEEAERRARQKAEAEARYAEMKEAGQFKMQPVGVIEPKLRQSNEIPTPRDSGIVLESTPAAEEQQRYLSTGTVVVHPIQSTEQAYMSVSGSEAPDSTAKPNRGLMSRLHFKRPSFSNLKRVRSDMNISASSNRDSSTSVSPIKTEFDSVLRKSVSKVDLKKQHKLSKRVSDLELRLQQARQELDDALVDASPVPQLNSKYQRFVPSATLRRSKFMPGKLPTLSSQQIFDPAQSVLGEDERHQEVNSRSETRTRQALDLTTAFDEEDEEEEETIRASREKQYPMRASTLFNLDNDNSTDAVQSDTMESTDKIIDGKTQNDQAVSMEHADITEAATEVADAEPDDSANYSSLDAKLKALDAQVKLAAKSKNKKRKSSDKDGVFKPTGNYDDDEDEVNEDAEEKRQVKRKKSKKRKVANKNDDSPATKRVKGVKNAQSSPKHKNSKPLTGNTSLTPLVGGMSVQDRVTVAVEIEPNDLEIADGGTESEGLLDVTAGRLSIDSQAPSLEPVYEEEEELNGHINPTTPTVLIGNSPSISTASTAPARHSRDFAGARTNSPKKNRPATVEANDMPHVRGKENGNENGRKGKEEFSWPEDVF